MFVKWVNKVMNKNFQPIPVASFQKQPSLLNVYNSSKTSLLIPVPCKPEDQKWTVVNVMTKPFSSAVGSEINSIHF